MPVPVRAEPRERAVRRVRAATPVMPEQWERAATVVQAPADSGAMRVRATPACNLLLAGTAREIDATTQPARAHKSARRRGGSIGLGARRVRLPRRPMQPGRTLERLRALHGLPCRDALRSRRPLHLARCFEPVHGQRAGRRHGLPRVLRSGRGPLQLPRLRHERSRHLCLHVRLPYRPTGLSP
jgi:hypothetical protein